MAGNGAQPPEVTRGLDQPGAKVPLPHPVGDHARGERIGRVDNPVGQRQPAGLLGGIGGEGKRRKPGIEGQRRARADFVAGLFGIAAVEDARGLRGRESPGEYGQPPVDLGDPRGEPGLVGVNSGQRRAILLREPVGSRGASGGGWGRRGGVKGLAVRGIGDLLEGRVGAVGQFDPVLNGGPIGIDALAVAGPHDPVDGRRGGEADFHPAAAGGARHPAPLVPLEAIVNERELVATRGDVIPRGDDGGTGGGERDVVAFSVEDLELIDAGLEAVGGEDREPHARGAAGDDPVDVQPGRHGCPRRSVAHKRSARCPCRVECRNRSPVSGDLGAAGVGLGGTELAVFVGDAGEHRLEGVVITERERIKLVVVAAGAADREAEEALTGVDENVVEGILAGEPL